MSYSITATQAKLDARADLTILNETNTLMKHIITDANNGHYSSTISDGTTMTESTPTITITGDAVFNPTITGTPTVIIAAPIGGGVQAQGSAFIFNGQVVSVAVNEPGSGYTQAPLVTLSGGGGVGAAATAVLDTVDFELDINGAIRTSTSIISDTARILNLDIDNFVTPNAAFRAPSLKTFANNTGTLW